MAPQEEKRDDFPLAFKSGRRRTSFPPPNHMDLPLRNTAPGVGASSPVADTLTGGVATRIQQGCDTWQPVEELRRNTPPSNSEPAGAQGLGSQELDTNPPRGNRPESRMSSAPPKTEPSADCEMLDASNRSGWPGEQPRGLEHPPEPLPRGGVKRLRVGHALQLLDTNVPALRPGSAHSKASEPTVVSLTEANEPAEVSGRRAKSGSAFGGGGKGGIPKVPVKDEEGESDSVAEEGGLAYCRKEKSLGLLCDK
jgi:hypothetical protein